jgi:CO/xanthine dehydrogenase Mo-binding subunit
MTAPIIGQNVTKIDAVGKVTGQTLYPGDLVREGMLHMKMLFSDRAHARIRSIDTSAAEKMPGVAALFTAKDVPHNEYGLIMPDQPVLCGPGSSKDGADIVRTMMDNIALIIADTEEHAAAARDLIEVEYEDLPAVFDPYEAMKDGAPQLHANTPNNVIVQYRIRKGDMDAGWKAADVVVEGTYKTNWQEHAYLQPEAGLAYIDEQGRVTVEVAGQFAHEDQEQICHALGLPAEQVRVIYPAIGGAFGGREDMSVQIVLALAVWKLRRPVKVLWSREESMRYHHKRHPITIKTNWGATRDGILTAAEVEVVGDAGGYAYTSTKVLGNANMMCTGPYVFPNAKVDTYTVYTNNIPTGAFRGFGGPQGALAAENQMNRLAEALGMDPVEIRLKNLLRDGDLTTVGTPLPKGVTIAEVTEKCALSAGWQKSGSGWTRPALQAPSAPHKRRGIGVAAAFKNVGFSFGAPEKCVAIIELHGGTEIERVVLRHAGADVGQGAHTVMAQMAAEAVGVPLEKVETVMSDTATSEFSGSSSASRMTFMSGNSIRGAAEEALKGWKAEERPAIAMFTYRPPKTTMFDPQTGKSEPNFAYGYVTEAVGELAILNVVCANDVGHAINPQLVQGQIEGAVVQAQGYAVMENFQMQGGKVMTPYLSNYLIPTVLDIPQHVESVILEYPDPIGPWGARGMGEMPLLPFAPALSAAIKDATGVWVDEIPMTSERMIRALRAAGLGQ